MGAVYMTIYLWRKSGDLDWAAAKAAALALTPEQINNINAGLEDHPHEELVEHIEALRVAWLEQDELVVAESPDATWEIWTTGGDSYGDWPNETYGVLSTLVEVPSVLKALGFVNV